MHVPTVEQPGSWYDKAHWGEHQYWPTPLAFAVGLGTWGLGFTNWAAMSPAQSAHVSLQLSKLVLSSKNS
eukprot:1161193-Pelagomonas_calceolata.AAC.8